MCFGTSLGVTFRTRARFHLLSLKYTGFNFILKNYLQSGNGPQEWPNHFVPIMGKIAITMLHQLPSVEHRGPLWISASLLNGPPWLNKDYLLTYTSPANIVKLNRAALSLVFYCSHFHCCLNRQQVLCRILRML